MKKIYLSLLIGFLLIGFMHSQAQVKKQVQQQVQPKPQVMATIKVMYPNGREEWEKGNRYTIRWTSRGIQGNVKIKLKYGPGRGSWYTIAESTPNTGNYTFTFPEDFLKDDYASEKYWFYIFVMTLNENIKDGSDRSFIVRTKPELRLIYPNGGEKLERFKEHNIRWHSRGRVGPLRLSYENEDLRRSYTFREERIPNRRSYRLIFPERLPLGNYKLRLTSLDGKIHDESDRTFELILPEVDLACGFIYFGRVTRKKIHILSGEKTKSMKFEVFIQNNGTKILNRVPVMWTLLKQPVNLVVKQSEAGFGNVYPNRQYKTSFEFKYSEAGYVWIFTDTERKLEKGDYTFVFEVDPRNELREPEASRANNKCDVNFKIE
jgi:hypothetical protein